jgi:hypothetical protein
VVLGYLSLCKLNHRYNEYYEWKEEHSKTEGKDKTEDEGECRTEGEGKGKTEGEDEGKTEG